MRNGHFNTFGQFIKLKTYFRIEDSNNNSHGDDHVGGGNGDGNNQPTASFLQTKTFKYHCGLAHLTTATLMHTLNDNAGILYAQNR